MKLVLQCSVCGTHHAVGTSVCPTCKATGVQNLRLMFECPRCFGLGITPVCQPCNPPALPYEVVEEEEKPLPVWEPVDDADAEERAADMLLSLDEPDETDDGDDEPDDSELALDGDE